MGLIEIINNFRTIIEDISGFVKHLPPHARLRLITWLVFQKIIRKPGLPAREGKISRLAQRTIENQVALYAGYMVIFAHDDAVDKFALQTWQIYDQLSRCLVAFFLGLFFENSQTTAGILALELRKWLDHLQRSLTDFPEIEQELPFLLNSAPLLSKVSEKDNFSIRNLLIEQGYDNLCQEWLNASIVSALGMGRAFRQLSTLLRQYLGETEATQSARYEFFIKILVQCMYAQAHSPEQKSWDGISYGRFIELSYLKSTILMDLYQYVSDQVNESRFFATRHNPSRTCEQIYDDLQDYEEDTRDQVLGILHMHILEQGRLAEIFLSGYDGVTVAPALVKNLVSTSQILRTTYDQTFIYHNPYVRAARDVNGDVEVAPEQIEMILREMWVNAPEELGWSLEKLARQRVKLAQQFKQAWLNKDVSGALDILHQSNFPMALAKSFSQFSILNKSVTIDSYIKHGAPRAGYVGYFAVTFGLGALWISLWFKHAIRHAPIFSCFGKKGGTHVNRSPT